MGGVLADCEKIGSRCEVLSVPHRSATQPIGTSWGEILWDGHNKGGPGVGAWPPGRLPPSMRWHVGRDDTPAMLPDVVSVVVDTLVTGCHASGNAQQFSLLARFKITEQLQQFGLVLHQ